MGIIAAFLGQQGRKNALRQVWLGTGTAVAICIGIAVLLQVISSDLPQRQQEGLETVVGALAVCMVTYMIMFMRRHARGLKGDLEGAAASALAVGDLSSTTVPFYGSHQAGIATPAQDRLAFGSLNVVSGASRADLRDLLRQPNAPPVDTGEAVGSPVSRLTVTIGYGPSLFDDRFGLAARKPAALAVLPPLPNENLDPAASGGDLCVQACSDDPLVAFHAVRNLARIGMGAVEHNWLELGFGRTSTTSTAQQTPRNLLGFKDGTRNIKAEQAGLMNEHVWVARSSPARRAFPPASTGVTDCSPDARHAGRRCRRLTAARSACRSCSVVPPQMP